MEMSDDYGLIPAGSLAEHAGIRHKKIKDGEWEIIDDSADPVLNLLSTFRNQYQKWRCGDGNTEKGPEDILNILLPAFAAATKVTESIIGMDIANENDQSVTEYQDKCTCTNCGNTGIMNIISKKTLGGMENTLHFQCPFCLDEYYL